MKTGETWLLIFGIGGITALGVALMQPVLDWRNGVLKPAGQYFLLVAALWIPFIIGFVICC